LRLALGGGPAHVPAGRPGVGLTGVRSLCVGADGDALARGPRRALLADGLDVLVEPGAELRWAVCPVLDDGLTYRSTWVAVDLRLDDGTWFAASGPHDQYGVPATAEGQGAARILVPDHWNLVRVDLSAAAGRTVTAVAVVVAPATGTPPGPVEAWLDDVAIGVPERRVVRGLVDHVDTRRGTHSTGSYSRGNTVPAAAVPNGAALWVPLTDGASGSWLYSWAAHNGPDNRPRLHGVAVSHVPSPWMGDRDQLAVHLVPASGTRADGVPDGSLEARGLAFDHAAELARPHHYGVALDGGARVDVTPTDHGAVLRLTFPAGDAVGYVVLDAVGTEGAAEPGRPVRLRIEPETGTITGWSDHGSGLSVGRSRMYVVGRLDRPVLRAGRAAGDRPHARYATVDLSAGSGGRTVELRLATSFVGVEQAWRTFARELEGVPFAKVEARARAAWEERLGVVEVEGATDDQLTTLYSCLYRLNLYPTSQTEDAGEPGRPRPVHASPVLPHAGPSTDDRTGAVVVDGEIFVNHGFWDTYRTSWPAYALLHPMLAGRLADGFVQQYREAGWVARWSSPGYADLMTGTSSDVAFADLLARGVSLPDPSAAYEAGLRNATAIPPHAGVGRKGQEHALLHGWVPREVHESVSWSLEGYVNDAGLAAMARQLAVRDGVSDRRRRALLDEAAYLERRALGYVHLFDRATGFFRGRGSDGTFVDPAGFDPAEWGGDYTESDAWNFAFHVPHDGAGLARLHGGPEGLAAVLERFFATPERADRPGSYGSVIHEMSEARDVRLGQLGQSNQVSHPLHLARRRAAEPGAGDRPGDPRAAVDRKRAGPGLPRRRGQRRDVRVVRALGARAVPAGGGLAEMGAGLSALPARRRAPARGRSRPRGAGRRGRAPVRGPRRRRRP
jgi:predicted alpha-1,2-mannosidase